MEDSRNNVLTQDLRREDQLLETTLPHLHSSTINTRKTTTVTATMGTTMAMTKAMAHRRKI